MDKETRNLVFNTTQAIRRLLEEEFSLQLEGTFDVHADGRIAEQPGSQLSAAERLVRCRIVEAIQHRLAVGESAAEAVRGFQSEAVFTFLNRLAALKMMEARALVLPCVSQSDQSQGFKEFSGLAPGLIELPDKGYRLYLECLFDEIGREVGVLFDRTDAASQLWPRRKALEAALAKLNTPELSGVWAEDETIGWIYQYYNDPEERKQMREESSAPRNSRELAVRNQFFTPRYVVEFLTDNTLGRIWYEMTKGQTRLKDQCRYLVRRPTEIFLGPASEVSGQHQGAASAQDSASTLNPDAEPCTLSQEDLLRQPVHIPHRPLKDPREIRMIDPACGSMHFGLYAFDLFTVIYDEAWEMAHGMDATAKSSRIFAPFVTFVASFADKASFLREVPRLIVEHNIHGIDIDPRAAQIAGLALWLRAQRGWQALGLKSSDRPPIRRSNIVCAEPMPGERGLLREFVDRQFPQGERSLFQSFLENVWDKMRLAGEAGSLLKIEEEIRSAIEDAREAWRKLSARPMELFSATELNRISSAPELTGMDQAVSSLTADPRSLTTDFWERIEERIYAALRDYAEQAENDGGFQRRLFAEDAARGFAFIDVCRKRYDVALMNPPFGEKTDSCDKILRAYFPRAQHDLALCFVERAYDLLDERGMIGPLTTRTGFYLSGAQEWRESLLGRVSRWAMADLGLDVLDDAMVQVAAYALSLGSEKGRKSWFCRLLKTPAIEKGPRLFAAIQNTVLETADSLVFELEAGHFSHLPGKSLGYWLSAEMLKKLGHMPTGKECDLRVRIGLQTSNDARYLRSWLEVSAEETSWMPFAKGGEFSPYFDDINLVVYWKDNGTVFWTPINPKLGKPLSNIWMIGETVAHYFGAGGLTYPRRTSKKFNPRILPQNCAFGDKGPVIRWKTRAHELAFLGIGSSRVFEWIMTAQVGREGVDTRAVAISYEAGVLLNSPFPALGGKEVEEFATVGRSLAETALRSLRFEETSHFFVQIAPLIQSDIATTAENQIRAKEDVILDRCSFEGTLEEMANQKYGLGNSDIAEMNSVLLPLPAFYPKTYTAETRIAFSKAYLSAHSSFRRLDDADGETSARGRFHAEDIEGAAHLLQLHPATLIEFRRQDRLVRGSDLSETTSSLLSWLLGHTFGRWDIRYATGEQAAPELPDPFAPLPVCPPGQLQNAQGLPARPEDVPTAYPVRIPWDGILVDDPNHPLDLARRLREVIEIIWSGKEGGPTAEAIEHEACEILGMKSLRDYFRKPAGFFADHLKRYSKSRRQAPIYWPLSSPNGLYTVWLYYHRLTADTLFTVLRDHVKPKLEYEERQAFQLRQEAGATPSTSQRRDIAEAEELVEDLRAFKAELDRVAPLFRPDLNDGVIINHAPLWRMIGLPKWRKDCQATWNELVKGDYDWAHLALHLWPERVIPKCATDRSLAIAHGLDAIFWREDPEKPGKWIARKVTDLELRGLIAERTSAAVKAAVESLVGATSNEGAPRRGRKGAKA